MHCADSSIIDNIWTETTVIPVTNKYDYTMEHKQKDYERTLYVDTTKHRSTVLSFTLFDESVQSYHTHKVYWQHINVFLCVQ